MQAIYKYGKRTSLDYVAAESAANAGDVVVLEDRVGVVNRDIPIDELGAVDVAGVFELPKVTEDAIAQGATLYWDDDADPADAPEAGTGAVSSNPEDGPVAGFAAAAAAEDDATVLVELSADPVPAD